MNAYRPGGRSDRQESQRFRSFEYTELLERDKANLDLFWLRDESLDDLDSLPPPDIVAAEIVEDLEAVLAEFADVAQALSRDGGSKLQPIQQPLLKESTES